MITSTSTHHLGLLRKSMCALVAASHFCVFAAPAQESLLTATAGPKPNVVLTLDDSGSMNWHMMPTEAGQLTLVNTTITTYNRRNATVGGVNCRNLASPIVSPPAPVPSPVACYTTSTTTGNVTYQFYPKIHPSDNDGNGRNISGVVDTNATGYNSRENVFAAQFRSSTFNGNYYNPDTVYEPWPAAMRNISANLLNSDGSIKDPAQTPTLPDGNPNGSASTATVDLVNASTTTNNWCASGMGINGLVQAGTTNGDPYYTCPSASRTFNPAVYFKLKAGRTGASINDFDRIDINQITDTATKAAQLKNFAIWFTYYRNRIYTAKGAVALAFDKQKQGQFRLGWGSINNGQSTTDGYTSNTLRQGVRTFSAANKTAFFNWLRPLDADGGTPLRRAMKDIGEYYRTENAYRTDPAVSTTTALSCRRNYHILVTDGYWNDGSQNVGNQDGSATGATEYTDPDGFKYKYAAVSPFSDAHSETLADVAMKYWRTDLINLTNNIPITKEAKAAPNNPDNNPAFWQHMVNFTVGLGVSGSIKNNPALGSFSWPQPVADESTTIDDLWHAAVNTRGKYLSARDPIGFSKSLSNILSNITSSGGTVSGVAVSRSTLASDILKFEPSFEPNKWSGELTAVKLNAQTGAESSVAWNASHKVPAHGLRNLWMGTGSGAAEFLVANLTGTTPLGHISTTGANAGVAPAVNADLVNYLRGDSSKEGPELFRPRQTVELDNKTIKTNVLGSMVNSVPLYIKSANFGNRFLPPTVNGISTGSSTYNAFLNNKRLRSGLVVVGANDGMIHGFRASDGVEMFGFIPKAILRGETHPNTTSESNLFGLARLADPNYEHQFYMDGQLTEADVSACQSGSCTWKNIVVASAGGGAKTMVALDLTTNFNNDSATEPALFSNSNVLWELSNNADLGYVMAPAAVGMLPSGQWAAVFGNGYDSASGKAVLFIVNALTGSLIKKIEVGTAGGNGLGGVRLVRDINNVVRHAYAGDLNGNVWKFDMTEQKVDLGGTALFTATHNGTPQPITATPNYTLHPTKGLMVIVPTGKLYSTSDQSSTGQQTIYGLWDQAAIGAPSTAGAAITADKLIGRMVQTGGADATKFTIINDGAAPANPRGWKVRMLFADGERGIYTPQFISGFAYVETVKPGQLQTESCSIAEGSGYGYLINTITGTQPASPIMDLDGSGKPDTGDNFGVFQRTSKARGTVIRSGTGEGGSGAGGDGDGNNKKPNGVACSEGSICKGTFDVSKPRDRYWRQLFWTIR